MNKKGVTSFFPAVVVGVLIVLALTPVTPAGPASPRRGGELVVALSRDLVSTDPLRAGNIDSNNYNHAIAEPLVLFGKQGLDPWVLESWKAEQDGTFTWNVRKGVKFTDGTPVNAEAVKISIDRTLDPRTESPQRAHFINRNSVITVVDEYTLKVKNRSYDTEFMDRMTSTGIVSAAAIRRGADFRREPVGSGAFKFVSYTPGERIVLERNGDYWRPGEPYVDRLVLRIIPEESVRLIELEAGSIHFAVDMAAADLRRARERGMQLVATQALGSMNLFFNLKRVTDSNVRRAVSHSIDRDAIIRALYPGDIAEVSQYYLPKAMGTWDDSRIPTHPYDPEAARRVLDEAGWKLGPDGVRANSKGEKLSWVMLAPTIPKWLAGAEMISGMLRRVGIQANISIADFRTFETACIKGEHDVCYYEWPGSSNDPWHNTTMTSSKYFWNMGQFNDPVLDRLHEANITTLDRARRKQVLFDYFTHVQKNTLYVTVGHKPYLYIARPEVRGVHVAFTRALYHGTWLNK